MQHILAVTEPTGQYQSKHKHGESIKNFLLQEKWPFSNTLIFSDFFSDGFNNCICCTSTENYSRLSSLIIDLAAENYTENIQVYK